MNWVTYENGNYKALIDTRNGTKIRQTNDNKFYPNFPESIDVKITNNCDMLCPMCHEVSTPDGKHGDILNAQFIDSLHPYTELAIGGGNPLTHPDLIAFLDKLYSKKVIANITVNQTHFVKGFDVIRWLTEFDLVKGIGVSLTDINEEFVKKIKYFDNTVIHVINGMITLKELEKLYDKDLKILILGYKMKGRGLEYYRHARNLINKNMEILRKNMVNVMNHFKIVSFDNLAIEQLEIQHSLSPERWVNFYNGGKGEFTMYIDLVENKFALSSTSLIKNNLLDNVDRMFVQVRKEGGFVDGGSNHG